MRPACAAAEQLQDAYARGLIWEQTEVDIGSTPANGLPSQNVQLHAAAPAQSFGHPATVVHKGVGAAVDTWRPLKRARTAPPTSLRVAAESLPVTLPSQSYSGPMQTGDRFLDSAQQPPRGRRQEPQAIEDPCGGPWGGLHDPLAVNGALEQLSMEQVCSFPTP